MKTITFAVITILFFWSKVRTNVKGFKDIYLSSLVSTDSTALEKKFFKSPASQKLD